MERVASGGSVRVERWVRLITHNMEIRDLVVFESVFNRKVRHIELGDNDNNRWNPIGEESNNAEIAKNHKDEPYPKPRYNRPNYVAPEEGKPHSNCDGFSSITRTDAISPFPEFQKGMLEAFPSFTMH